MEKLILIDGSSLLSTSFFGNLPKSYLMAKTDEDREKALEKVMKTKDGQYTNGVFTMMRIFEKLIKTQKPTHMAVAWDISRETFRRKLYADYKAQRKATKPELKSQFQLAQEVLKAMNITQFAIDGYEADDILGTLSKKFSDDINVFIWTKDQDAIQLVDEKTRLWLITSKAKEMSEQFQIERDVFAVPDNAFEYTPLYEEEVYGIKPKQIIDFKALEGDTSDNIPGVSGVGEKSIIPLLNEFGTVEALYEYIESHPEKEVKAFFKELGMSRPPYKALLKESGDKVEGKESALLSKELATINCNMDELSHVLLSEMALDINQEGRKAIYEKLEFSSLLN